MSQKIRIQKFSVILRKSKVNFFVKLKKMNMFVEPNWQKKRSI